LARRTLPLPVHRHRSPTRASPTVIPRPPAAAILAILSLLTACGEGATDVTAVSSFNRIQEVFDAQCVSCHAEGNPYAVESGLVLTRDRSWSELVGVQPTNTAARADGLLRVRPNDPGKSLLFHKLRWDAGHHTASYGSPMPLGGEPPYNGEVEFIRRWIDAGAPRTGEVVDVSVLEDRTRPATDFYPLPPPAKGFQLRVEPFTVAPNFERELFVYRTVGNSEEVFVNRIETRMRLNSHHLLLYTFSGIPSPLLPAPGAVRDIRNVDGSLNVANMVAMAYHVFFGGAMTPTSDYRFPPGVALRLPPNAALDLNSHYVNRTAHPIVGEAYANLHTVDRSEVVHVARTLNLSNTGFTLPARQRTTVTTTFLAGSSALPVGSDDRVRIPTLTSHMHELGERFVIRITGGPRDGEVVYTNTDWSHPEMVTFSPAITLRRGEGLTSVVTYNNTRDTTVRFGLTSRDEMNIIFGYAY
jgi:hypothetical protein